MEALVAGARDAIGAERYSDYSDTVLAGTSPWSATAAVGG